MPQAAHDIEDSESWRQGLAAMTAYHLAALRQSYEGILAILANHEKQAVIELVHRLHFTAHETAKTLGVPQNEVEEILKHVEIYPARTP